MSVEQQETLPFEVVSAGSSEVPADTPPATPPVQGSTAAAEESGVVAKPSRDETERLDPVPTEMRLVSGTEFDLEPLKLRQFLRLLRIVTRGAADVLDTASIDFEDPQAFVQTFLGMVLFSIPEAEEETVEFIKSMVKPKGLTGDPNKDLIKVRELSAELDNPDLEDTVTVVQVIIENEAEDLRALGKRLSKMFKVAQKMGAAPA